MGNSEIPQESSPKLKESEIKSKEIKPVTPIKNIINRINPIHNLVLLIMIPFFIFPFVWTITAAFRRFPLYTVEFKNFTFENFISLLDVDMLTWIKNSLILGIGVIFVANLTGFFAAYIFSRYKFIGKQVLLFVLILSMTIPLSVVMVPTYAIVRRLGLANTRLGIILVLSAQMIPIAIWILKEFIDGIPKEIEESAKIEGAGTLTIISKIIFPLALPGIGVIGLMSFLKGWGDFTLNLILINKEKLYPLSIGIYRASIAQMSGGASQVIVINYGIMAAIALVYLIPPAVIFILMQKYFAKGMTLGAVKG